MPRKPESKQDEKKMESDLEGALATIKHGMDKDAVRRAANNTTTWSLDSGGDSGYSDRYMKNIAKGGLAIQRKDMRDTADSEQAKKSGGSVPFPSYKKGGKVKVTGLALVHKGEKVIPKNKVKKVEKALRKR